MNRIFRPLLWVAGLYTVVLLVLGAQRLRYGVDVTDESFYAALPYEFSLGNQIFIDEMAAQQSAALLVTPVVSARVRFRGGTDGLVLFLRHLYLLLACGVAVGTFLVLKRFVRAEAAAMAALLPVALIPFSIPSLGYNTMGAVLLTAGTMAGAASLKSRRVGFLTIVQIAMFAFAAVSYPPLAVAVIAAVLISGSMHVRAGTGRTYLIVAATAGGAILAIFAFYCLGRVQLRDVLASIDYVRSFGMHGAGLAKWERFAHQWKDDLPYRGVIGWELLVLAVLSVIGLRRARDVAVCGILLLLPVAALERGSSSHYVLIVLVVALLPSVVLAAVRGSDESRILLLTCCVPGLFAGCATALSSSNGLGNAVIGLFPAAASLLALAVESAADSGFLLLAFGASLAIPSVLHAASTKFVYRDDPMVSLTRTIESGPFSGLRTTPEKAQFLAQIRGDALSEAADGKTCLFFDDFPAGYLFTSMRPLSPSVWLPAQKGYPAFDRMRHVRFFTNHEPDVVFEMRNIPLSSTEREDLESYATDPLQHFFWRRGYRIAAERAEYTVYERCAGCRASAVDLDAIAPLAPGASYGDTASRGWTWYETNADGGRAAITRNLGALLEGSIPGFQPGDYEVDLSFVNYGPEGQNRVSLAVGKRVRELAFGPGGEPGLYRVSNVLFRGVTSPHFEIRPLAIGQQSLILDTAVFRRLTAPQSARPRPSFVSVGEETEVQRVLEAESMSGVLPGHDMTAVSRGWVSYSQPYYSARYAVLTNLPGAELRQSLGTLTPGDYEVTFSIMDYGTPNSNEVEARIGDARCRAVAGGFVAPSDIRAVHCTLRKVTSGVLIVRSIAIHQQSLIIDRISLKRLP